MYMAARSGVIILATVIAIVTDGLMWAPETWKTKQQRKLVLLTVSFCCFSRKIAARRVFEPKQMMLITLNWERQGDKEDDTQHTLACFRRIIIWRCFYPHPDIASHIRESWYLTVSGINYQLMKLNWGRQCTLMDIGHSTQHQINIFGCRNCGPSIAKTRRNIAIFPNSRLTGEVTQTRFLVWRWHGEIRITINQDDTHSRRMDFPGHGECPRSIAKKFPAFGSQTQEKVW